MTCKPEIAQKGPYAVEVEVGKTYYWCACGRSRKQPFCDGSHKLTDCEPLAFTVEQAGTVYLCGCKHSAGKPYCDGSHKGI